MTAAPSLSLRPATAADVPALAALGRDSFIAKFGDLYRPEDLAGFLDPRHARPVGARQVAP